MRVRKVDETGDMVFGRSQADYWRDVPEAVAQVAQSRLELFQGEWFLDLSDGTPWRTQVLGKFTGSTRDMVIRARLLGTPGLESLDAYSSAVDRDSRAFSASAAITTQYGALERLRFTAAAPIL